MRPSLLGSAIIAALGLVLAVTSAAEARRKGPIAAARQAIAECDEAAYQRAVDRYARRHPNKVKQGPLGIETPPEFPKFPFPCHTQQARPGPLPLPRFADSPARRIRQDLIDVYIAGELGGSDLCTDQTFVDIFSLGVPDPFNPNRRRRCAASFVGGGTVGVRGPAIHSPNTAFFNGLRLGGEVTILGGGSEVTFPGTPTTTLGPLPGTDNYRAKDNFIILLNATATIPIIPNVNFTVNGGYGWANKTVIYDCNGFCTLAGTPPFSQSQDVTLGGPSVGFGIDFGVPAAPIPLVLGFHYNHIFIGNKVLQFGDRATVFTQFDVAQDIDIFTMRATVPLAGDFWAHGLNTGVELRY
jgi:hypothetical protein